MKTSGLYPQVAEKKEGTTINQPTKEQSESSAPKPIPMLISIQTIYWYKTPIEILVHQFSNISSASQLTETQLLDIVRFIKNQFMSGEQKEGIKGAISKKSNLTLVFCNWNSRSLMPLQEEQIEFIYGQLADFSESADGFFTFIFSLYQSQKFSDIILYNEDGSGRGFKAHKLILWSRIPELQNVLLSNPSSIQVNIQILIS